MGRCIPIGSQYTSTYSRNRNGPQQNPTTNQKNRRGDRLPLRVEGQSNDGRHQISGGDAMQNAVEGVKRRQVELEKVALGRSSQGEQKHRAFDGMRVKYAAALMHPLPLSKGEGHRHSHHEHE